VEVAEQREKAREGRMLGLARGLYDEVYRNKVYDLEIDTSSLTPEEAAQMVIQYIDAHPCPQAFEQMIFF
jgi:chloramphenicol 3-O phosphotransferase